MKLGLKTMEMHCLENRVDARGLWIEKKYTDLVLVTTVLVQILVYITQVINKVKSNNSTLTEERG